MGTIPYAWSGVDGQGNPRTGSGLLEVASAASCVFGQQFASGTVGTLPAGTVVPAARIYFQPGDFTGSGQPTWANQSLITQALARGASTFILSTKDATPTALGKWVTFLRSIPFALKPNVWCIYMHEHEAKLRNGSLTFAEYDANFDAVRQVTQAEGFKFGPLHNGLNRNAADTAWIFGNYVEPTSLASCDFDALDCYDPNDKGANSLFFSNSGWWPYFRDTGLPILIGETGSPAGTKQPGFAAEMRAACLARPQIRVACWWNQQFTGNPDYRMTAATVSTWLP